MNTLPIASLKQDVLIDDRKHNHFLLFFRHINGSKDTERKEIFTKCEIDL